ncbi:hypothetical protein GCM10027596_41210 [Nocardioides korecus]
MPQTQVAVFALSYSAKKQSVQLMAGSYLCVRLVLDRLCLLGLEANPRLPEVLIAHSESLTWKDAHRQSP